MYTKCINKINLRKYFICIEMYIILQPMSKDKKPKANIQLLIHGMDINVYKVVLKLAKEEKRSAGKQAEYMLSKFIEQNNLKPVDQ